MNIHINNSQTKRIIVIILGFWFTFYVTFYMLKIPYDTFVRSYVPSGSEYSMREQLQRLYLFILVLISVVSYRANNEHTQIKLSISFLLFGLVMYMTECNILAEKVRPILGAIFFVYICILFFRAKAWLSFTFFVIGSAVTMIGVLVDIEDDFKAYSSSFPDFLSPLLSSLSPLLSSLSSLLYIERFDEEKIEALGIAFFCLSAIIVFLVPIQYFISKNIKAVLLMFLASVMITYGNGFSFQYSGRENIKSVGLVLAIIGFFGLMFINKKINNKSKVLTLVTEDIYYLFIYSFFVVVPSIYGNTVSLASLVLWIPTMLFIARYMWRCRALNHKTK